MKSRQVKHDGEEGKKEGEVDRERDIWGEKERNTAAIENSVGLF
jgi:hypothetical protein